MSAIVTGGFHTPGIEKYLAEQGYSYAVIAPKISKIQNAKKEASLYETAMRGRAQGWSGGPSQLISAAASA